jgi:DNA-binding GntR family transcriptional regulator
MLRELFDAVDARDAARAAAVVRDHFREVDERVLPQLDLALREVKS